MSEKGSGSGGGVGFFGLLTILFVGLKLTGYIDWSWWWVTSPFWGGYVVFFTAFMCGAAFAIISEMRRK